MADYRCTHCHASIDVLPPVGAWFELTRQPGGASAGQRWIFCSLACLEVFLKGGEDA